VLSATRARFQEGSPVVIALVILHVTVCFAMLILVLLHSGKGGGLSDMFGGGMGAAAQGSTVVEKNLDRLTVIAAVIFTFTTLSLGLLMSTPT
jgi:preprotein translocase subunit SecG